jgi:hypothetical protein
MDAVAFLSKGHDMRIMLYGLFQVFRVGGIY